MRNKKTDGSDKNIDLAKKQIDTSIENLANLETTIEAIQQELLNLQQQKLAAGKRANEAEKDIYINGQKYFILPNLARKYEEALSDAITFFEKKCPYCDTNLYDGHFRNKIEVDHYIPVSRGGQDVPWNILPVCKKCNRSKRDKTPEDFLETARRQYCEDYLYTIRKKLVDEIQLQVEQYQQIKNYLMAYQEKIPSMQRADLIDVLVNLAKLLKIDIKTSELIANAKSEALIAEFVEACCYPPEETTHDTRTQYGLAYSAFLAWYTSHIGDEKYCLKKKKFGTLMARQFKKEKTGQHTYFYGVSLLPEAIPM